MIGQRPPVITRYRMLAAAWLLTRMASIVWPGLDRTDGWRYRVYIALCGRAWGLSEIAEGRL